MEHNVCFGLLVKKLGSLPIANEKSVNRLSRTAPALGSLAFWYVDVAQNHLKTFAVRLFQHDRLLAGFPGRISLAYV
jgi:hypothetical protein